MKEICPMKKWTIIILIIPVSLVGQVPVNLGFRSGYFMTAGLQFDSYPWSMAIGYRLPGGWLSLGNNTRFGGLTTYEKPLLKVSDRNNFISFGVKMGIYAAQADYTRSEGRLKGMKFWTAGLTGGVGLRLKWQLFELNAEIMPGYEFSKYHEWGNRFFFWKCTGATLSLQLN